MKINGVDYLPQARTGIVYIRDSEYHDPKSPASKRNVIAKLFEDPKAGRNLQGQFKGSEIRIDNPEDICMTGFAMIGNIYGANRVTISKSTGEEVTGYINEIGAQDGKDLTIVLGKAFGTNNESSTISITAHEINELSISLTIKAAPENPGNN